MDLDYQGAREIFVGLEEEIAGELNLTIPEPFDSYSSPADLAVCAIVLSARLSFTFLLLSNP